MNTAGTIIGADVTGNAIVFMIDKYLVQGAEVTSNTLIECMEIAAGGLQTSTSAKGLSDSLPKAELDEYLKESFEYFMTDNTGKVSFGNTNSESSAKKYYQVTSKQNAETIINSNNPELKDREFKGVYVRIKQPTYKQAENSGARYLETVIEFETNATFSKDTSIGDTTLHGIARVSDRPGPIPISNVVEVGFKSEKRWWQFWKE